MKCFSFMCTFCQVSAGVWCLFIIIRAFEYGELSLFEVIGIFSWTTLFVNSNDIICIIAIVGFAPILFVAFIVLYE